jgi:DNA polymerase I-like protein with 3'-5' exonuclease and polymerase domains
MPHTVFEVLCIMYVIEIKAFQNDEDIHARTASEIFGVPMERVTPAMRREAR